MRYTIRKTTEYDDWLSSQTEKTKVQIAKRLMHIEKHCHFGTIRDVEDLGVKVEEWQAGLLYLYSRTNILLLLGGNKNGQSYDIAQSKKILSKYAEAEDEA